MKSFMRKKLNRDGNWTLYLAMVSVIIATLVAIVIAPLPAHAEGVLGEFGQARQRELLDEQTKLRQYTESRTTEYFDMSFYVNQVSMKNSIHFPSLVMA